MMGSSNLPSDGDVDNDIEGLRLMFEGMQKITPRMRQASIELVWDKYILQPLRDEKERAAKLLQATEASDGN